MSEFLNVLKGKVIHFIGVGGAGMSPMAHMLLDIGRSVTGSDLRDSTTIQALLKKGARIFDSHDAENVIFADIVVYSSAILDSNPELIEAKKRKLVICHRSEMLNLLMETFEKRIAVSGTHGKTTTTGMISYILSQAERPSSFMVGSVLENLDTNYYYTDSDIFVAEADESDGSFLNIDATIGVITNIEDEHMTYYKTRENLLNHFNTFSERICSLGGVLIYNYNDGFAKKVLSELSPEGLVSFGIDNRANVSAEDIVFSQKGARFRCVVDGNYIGDVNQGLYGYHNVCNALAAIAVTLKLGVSFNQIRTGLESFKGTKRRLQYVGEKNGISIYDDYGHHPTEIKTTLEGLRYSFKSKIFCIFQPHRFSRTKDLVEEFALSFDTADHVILMPIFTAHEKEIKGISTQSIIDCMPDTISSKTEYLKTEEEILVSLSQKIKAGDIVVTMGAGNINTLSHSLLKNLFKNNAY
jgi:UDP-N-acetylmuramate--alanine ligase